LSHVNDLGAAQFADAPFEMRHFAPLLGEHSREVLATWGVRPPRLPPPLCWCWCRCRCRWPVVVVVVVLLLLLVLLVLAASFASPPLPRPRPISKNVPDARLTKRRQCMAKNVTIALL
jgi:hypothetical protein